MECFYKMNDPFNIYLNNINVGDAESFSDCGNYNLTNLTEWNDEYFTDDSNGKTLEILRNCSPLLDTTDTFSIKNFSAGTQKEQIEFNLNCAEIYEENEKAERLNQNTCSTTEQMLSAENLNEIQPLRTKKKIRVFNCKLCPRKFRKEALLQAHLRVHEGLKPFSCSHCDKQFVRTCNLRIHIEQQHLKPNESFNCTYEGCNRFYTRKDALELHIKEYHSDVPDKEFICEVCGMIFQRKLFLDRHLLIHVDKSKWPFECDECGKKFNKKFILRDHLRRHAGIKNFVCIYCGMKKATKTELNVHMNYHTLEKTWTCHICKKVFKAHANLKIHRQIVHEGLRKYGCRYCSKQFGRADTRKHHEMRHTGERPHQCTECGREFIQAVALYSHMKVH